MTDLSTKVQQRVLSYFLADGSITPQQEFGNRHYYHLAGVGFAESPSLYEELEVEKVVSQLRSAPLFNVIFALLFHQFLFDYEALAAVKNIRLFIDGAHSLFSADFESYSFKYRPIYQFLRRVLANYRRWSEPVRAVLRDLWSLWASFCFFYERNFLNVTYNLKHMKLQMMLAQSKGAFVVMVPGQEPPDLGSAFDLMHIDDLFVRLAVKQLELVKDERVLIRFLRGCEVFSSLPLSRSVSMLLQAEIYERTKAGYPYYVPPEARRAARLTLDRMYPAGQWSRALVSFFFRLFQPVYSMQSIFRRIYMIYVAIIVWLKTRCQCCGALTRCCGDRRQQKSK